MGIDNSNAQNGTHGQRHSAVGGCRHKARQDDFHNASSNTAATAAYVELKDLVWRSIGAKIQERSKQAGMIVRDLNAGWPGHRVGYAESTAKLN